MATGGFKSYARDGGMRRTAKGKPVKGWIQMLSSPLTLEPSYAPAVTYDSEGQRTGLMVRTGTGETERRADPEMSRDPRREQALAAWLWARAQGWPSPSPPPDPDAPREPEGGA